MSTSGGTTTGLASWGRADTNTFEHAGDPNGAVTAFTAGDLCTDTTTPALWIAAGAGTVWTEVGGGSTAGTPIVRKFPFAFDTANILTGHTIYTPTIGDFLIDVWVEIDTAWNGVTPTGDVGQFGVGASTHLGFFGAVNAALDMTGADAVGNHLAGTMLGSTTTPNARLAEAGIGAPAGSYSVPSKFTTAAPIKVVVSQNGQDNGLTPASSQGAGVIYLVTCTPT